MNAPVSNLMDVDGDTNMDCMWGNHPIEQYIEKQIEDYRDGFRRYETPFERLSVRSSNSDELKFWAGSFVTNSRVPLIPPCIRDLPRDEYRAALMEKRDVISELKDLAREMYSLYKLVREPMLAELFGETAIRLRDEIGTIDREHFDQLRPDLDDSASMTTGGPSGWRRAVNRSNFDPITL
ncbi:hypothetical protein ACJZ2D_006548 [Fusarium nematophilum]